MCKLLLLFGLSLAIVLNAEAQGGKYSTFYYQRASLFEVLPVTSDDIVFLGNSITNGSEWCELFGDSRIKNRGISGDTTEGVYDRLEPIIAGRPKKIFLMIGVNDISRGRTTAQIADGIRAIAERIVAESPSTRLYLQSVLPVNDCYGMFGSHTSRYRQVPEINAEIQHIAADTGAVYVDLYTPFADPESGKMRPELTNDGLHLLGAGYLLWRDVVTPYVTE